MVFTSVGASTRKRENISLNRAAPLAPWKARIPAKTLVSIAGGGAGTVFVSSGGSGVTAARTHVTILAGESTYTELGVELGLLGALAFVAWSLVLLRGALRGIAWIGAAFAAVLFLGLQTDIIGVPWIAVVVWALAGDALRQSRNV